MGFQCIMFDVTNTGSLTRQSFSLTQENLTDAGTCPTRMIDAHFP